MENLSPEILRRLSKELISLNENPPEGIRYKINEKNITDIQCLIEGPPGTPYGGGHFRIRLALSKEFPATPPRGFFLTKVFHPNVAPNTGEICVNTLKKDWKPDLGIRHILLTIKCLLIAPNPESALNEEAGKMLMEDYEEYFRRANMLTQIHAMPKSSVSQASGGCESGASLKRQCDKVEDKVYKAVASQKKFKESKKALKRL